LSFYTVSGCWPATPAKTASLVYVIVEEKTTDDIMVNSFNKK